MPARRSLTVSSDESSRVNRLTRKPIRASSGAIPSPRRLTSSTAGARFGAVHWSVRTRSAYWSTVRMGRLPGEEVAELAARDLPVGPSQDDHAHAPPARHQVDRRLGEGEDGGREPQLAVGERDLGAGRRGHGRTEGLVQPFLGGGKN